jgi:hypothetical protein
MNIPLVFLKKHQTEPGFRYALLGVRPGNSLAKRKENEG